MMNALYDSGGPDEHAAREGFSVTIARLLAEPDRGRIVLFMQDGGLGGYAILIPYWSNEFGGTIVFVDELFVDAPFRGQGIATAFFAFLADARPFDAVALALEVAPGNARARALYEHIGFVERRHRMLTWRLTSAV